MPLYSETSETALEALGPEGSKIRAIEPAFRLCQVAQCCTMYIHGPSWPSPLASRHYRHLGIKNAIRPSAVGKRNWLFIGHPDAGWRSAVIYSVLVSCRRRGLDTWEYLKDVFTRLPAASNKDLAHFLPANWQAHRPSAD